MKHPKSVDPLFYPGEVAIWHLQNGDPANGRECVVLDFMEWCDDVCHVWPVVVGAPPGFYYPVTDSEGDWLAAPWELRKKRPPQAQESVDSCHEDGSCGPAAGRLSVPSEEPI